MALGHPWVTSMGATDGCPPWVTLVTSAAPTASMASAVPMTSSASLITLVTLMTAAASVTAAARGRGHNEEGVAWARGRGHRGAGLIGGGVGAEWLAPLGAGLRGEVSEGGGAVCRGRGFAGSCRRGGANRKGRGFVEGGGANWKRAGRRWEASGGRGQPGVGGAV